MHVSTEQVQQHSNKAMGERVKKKKKKKWIFLTAPIWGFGIIQTIAEKTIANQVI